MTEYTKEDLVLNNEDFIFIGFSNKGFDKNENQDRYLISHDEKSINVCIADGLGSSKFSHVGAEQAVNVMSELLKDDLSLNQLPSTFKQIWKEKINHELNLYDTTIKYFHITNEKINYGGIGDGLILIKYDESFINDHNRNSFTNQTESVNSPSYFKEFKRYSVPYRSFKGVMIATDGVSEDIYEDQYEKMLDTMVKRILSEENQFINDMVQLLDEWPVKTNHDDKTVVFLIKKVAINDE